MYLYQINIYESQTNTSKFPANVYNTIIAPISTKKQLLQHSKYNSLQKHIPLKEFSFNAKIVREFKSANSVGMTPILFNVKYQNIK